MTIQKLQLDKTASGHDAEAQMLERLGLADLKKKEGRTEEVIDTVSMYKKAGRGSTLYGIAGGSLGAVGGAELAGAFTDSATIKLLSAIAGGAGGAWAGAKAGDAIERDGGFKVTDEDDGAARHAATAMGITGGSVGWALSKYLMGNKGYGSHALSAALGAAAGGGIGYMSTAGAKKKEDEKQQKFINPTGDPTIAKQQEAVWSALNATRAAGSDGTIFTRVEAGKTDDGSPIYEYYRTENGNHIFTDKYGNIKLRSGRTRFGDEFHMYNEYRDNKTGNIYRRYTKPNGETYDQLSQTKVDDPNLDFRKNVDDGTIYRALITKGMDEDKAIYAQNMYNLLALTYPVAKYEDGMIKVRDPYDYNSPELTDEHRALWNLWEAAGLKSQDMPLPADYDAPAYEYWYKTWKEFRDLPLWQQFAIGTAAASAGVGAVSLPIAAVNKLNRATGGKLYNVIGAPYKVLNNSYNGVTADAWNAELNELRNAYTDKPGALVKQHNNVNDILTRALIDQNKKGMTVVRPSRSKLDKLIQGFSSGGVHTMTLDKASIESALRNMDAEGIKVNNTFKQNLDTLYKIHGGTLTFDEATRAFNMDSEELKKRIINANEAAELFDAKYRGVGDVMPYINKPVAPQERNRFIKAMFDNPNMNPKTIQEIAEKTNKSTDPMDSYKYLDDAVKSQEAIKNLQPGDTITFEGEQYKISQNRTFQTKDGTLYSINNEGKAVKLDNSLQPPKAQPIVDPKAQPTEQVKAQEAVNDAKGNWQNGDTDAATPKPQPTEAPKVQDAESPKPQPTGNQQSGSAEAAAQSAVEENKSKWTNEDTKSQPTGVKDRIPVESIDNTVKYSDGTTKLDRYKNDMKFFKELDFSGENLDKIDDMLRKLYTSSDEEAKNIRKELIRVLSEREGARLRGDNIDMVIKNTLDNIDMNRLGTPDARINVGTTSRPIKIKERLKDGRIKVEIDGTSRIMTQAQLNAEVSKVRTRTAPNGTPKVKPGVRPSVIPTGRPRKIDDGSLRAVKKLLRRVVKARK